jgi:hypothetical protein
VANEVIDIVTYDIETFIAELMAIKQVPAKEVSGLSIEHSPAPAPAPSVGIPRPANVYTEADS